MGLSGSGSVASSNIVAVPSSLKLMVRFMSRKPQSKTKLTDAERHKRFVAMAREVEASESAKAFDKAFAKVTAPRPPKNGSRSP